MTADHVPLRNVERRQREGAVGGWLRSPPHHHIPNQTEMERMMTDSESSWDRAQAEINARLDSVASSEGFDVASNTAFEIMHPSLLWIGEQFGQRGVGLVLTALQGGGGYSFPETGAHVHPLESVYTT
jgi:hypothetical protein